MEGTLHGPDPEVLCPLSYEPGEIAFCGFTQQQGNGGDDRG